MCFREARHTLPGPLTRRFSPDPPSGIRREARTRQATRVCRRIGGFLPRLAGAHSVVSVKLYSLIVYKYQPQERAILGGRRCRLPRARSWCPADFVRRVKRETGGGQVPEEIGRASCRERV